MNIVEKGEKKMSGDKIWFLKELPGIIKLGMQVTAGIPHKLRLHLREVRVKHSENLLKITMGFYAGEHKNDPKKWPSCFIDIDLEKMEISLAGTSSWLFNKDCKSSGMTKVALYSFPVIFLLSPILRGINKSYESAEKRRGISRYSYQILKALEGQLEPKTEKILMQAMKNMWRLDKYLSQ
ncbi:MAG: hypothetical protein COU51_00650 [Parcubacteria group bacterium CG10_big_fil_rev_8_21_14_0_10_36_14]|nr:MAG: hypothetical protein COU51_00650 [Parcubacteria group bacterium CG10_big_fil_rev_8_21_14_0_10_36_14]